MEEVYKSGKVKAIGVSNWSIPYLEHLEKTWTVVPVVNQVTLSRYCPWAQGFKYKVLNITCDTGRTPPVLSTAPIEEVV